MVYLSHILYYNIQIRESKKGFYDNWNLVGLYSGFNMIYHRKNEVD